MLRMLVQTSQLNTDVEGDTSGNTVRKHESRDCGSLKISRGSRGVHISCCPLETEEVDGQYEDRVFGDLRKGCLLFTVFLLT